MPHAAPVFSALGVALADLLYTFARSEPLPLGPDPVVLKQFNAIFEELERKALDTVVASGFRPEEALLTRRLDLRYEGQMHEITVPWIREPLTEDILKEIRRVFEEAYATRFGPATVRSESPLEVITFRVEALRPSQKPDLKPAPERPTDLREARKAGRVVTLRASGAMTADVYGFDALGPGTRLVGPAIIERRDTTVFVPPDFEARVDGYQNLHLWRGVRL